MDRIDIEESELPDEITLMFECEADLTAWREWWRDIGSGEFLRWFLERELPATIPTPE